MFICHGKGCLKKSNYGSRPPRILLQKLPAAQIKFLNKISPRFERNVVCVVFKVSQKNLDSYRISVTESVWGKKFLHA